MSLFLDLTQDGELEPYAHLVQPPARHLRMAIRDFSVPTREQLVATLDEIDGELRAGRPRLRPLLGGLWTDRCRGRSWLVRHGVTPSDALARIAEARGLGCPQTLEQRLFVLGWHEGV